MHSKQELQAHFFAPPLALQTNHLWLTPGKTLQFSVAIDSRHDWHAPVSGLVGTLHRYALLRVDFGVASNVIIQIRGAVQQQLEIDAEQSQPIPDVPQSGTTRDAGDFSVATILRVLEDTDRKTAFGFRVETRLPNTTQSKGIGTNTTDIYLSALLSRRFGAALVFGDLGIGILTAPRELDVQNDVLCYGLGFSFQIAQQWRAAGEVNGYLTTRNIIPLGTEARGLARAGLARLLGAFALEALATYGLTENEGKVGWSIGISRRVNW